VEVALHLLFWSAGADT